MNASAPELRAARAGIPSWLVVAGAVLLGVAVLVLPSRAVLALFAGAIGVALTTARPRLGLLAWFVSTPILGFWIRISLPAGVPDLTYDRGFVVLVIAVLAARRVAGTAGPWRTGRVELAMAAYAAVAAFGLLRGGNLTTDLQLLLDGYLTPFVVYVVARRIFADEPAPRAVLLAIGIVGLFLTAVGTAQIVLHRIPLVPDGFVPIHVHRMTGPFYNAAEFGGVVAIAGFAWALLAGLARGRDRRLAASIAAAICFGAALASLTRAVWLSSLIAAAVIAWRHSVSRRGLASAGIAALLVSAFALPLVIEPADVLERGAESRPVEIRLVSAMTAARMWIDRPLLGYGFGRWTYYEHRDDHFTAFGDISADSGTVVGVPHNEFLHQLVLTGAIGLGCHLAVWLGAWGAAATGRRRERDPARRALSALLLAALVVYLVNGMFADLLFFPFLTTTLCLLFGAQRGLLDAPRPTDSA